MKPFQPPYIRQLVFNVELLRKSKEDTDADRLAREQELDFDDVDLNPQEIPNNQDSDLVNEISYKPKIMSKTDLFSVYFLIRCGWNSEIPNNRRPFNLNAASLDPLSFSTLQYDNSLSYIQTHILDAWKREFKLFTKKNTVKDLVNTTLFGLARNVLDEASYEPNLIVDKLDHGSFEYIKASLGVDPLLEDILPHILKAFTPNKKQYLVIRNVVFRVLRIHDSRCSSATNSNEQFLLYIGGYGGTGKTQIINALLFALKLLDFENKCCVTASTGTAAAHIKGKTVHSAVGVIGQRKQSSISPTKLSTLQNLLRGTILFVVDEVSMVSTRLLGQIDKHCA